MRCAALSSDPYRLLSWSSGLLTDEGFYLANALNGAVFGREHLDEWNNSLLMPMLHLLQKGVFGVFGVGIIQARAISVVLSLLTLGFFYDALRRAFNPRTAQIGTAFLALDHTYLLYNRMALMDTAGAFVLTLAFWTFGVRRWASSGVMMGMAYATRGLALFVAAVPAWVLWRYNKKACGLYVAGLGLSLGVYAVVWYFPNRDEMSRIGQYYLRHQLLPQDFNILRLNVGRMLWGERGGNLFFLLHSPVIWIGAWAAFATKISDEQAALMQRALCGWLLCLAVPLTFSSYAPSRYFVLFLPAVCGLAAVALDGAFDTVKWKRLATFACVVWFCLNAAWLTDWMRTLRWTQRAAEQTLTARLPANSVLVGDAAPALSINTRFRSVNVIAGLCNDHAPLEAVAGHPRYVVILNGSKNVAWWKSRYPTVIQPANRLMLFSDVVGFAVAVYRVPDP